MSKLPTSRNNTHRHYSHHRNTLPIYSRSAEAFVPTSANSKPPNNSKSDTDFGSSSHRSRSRHGNQNDVITHRGYNAHRNGAEDFRRLTENLHSTTAKKFNRSSLKAKLKKKFHVDDTILDVLLSSVLDAPPAVSFEDIIGQEQAVKMLRERVVYPALNPGLFVGQKVLRPPRGVLLFGPTGNGKTLLAKACAAQTRYNFMNLTSSVLVSKWVGDSEKLIKMVFEIARELQPCIVFIDEIDAVLSQRNELEREDTRRFKNEFLTHFDGLLGNTDDRIMVLGATNLPQSIDTAALRRFDLRIFLGPPDQGAREILLHNILRGVRHGLSEADVHYIAQMTQQYSASDLGVIVRNAAWIPLGKIEPIRIPSLTESEIPRLRIHDFIRVIEHFVPSGYQADLKIIQQWQSQHKKA